MIKPKRLKPGDTVGIIAPASGVAPETWDRAVKNIESLGFKARIGKNARGRLSFLSATDRERLEDLHWAFSDPEINAVWCVRGGGGDWRHRRLNRHLGLRNGCRFQRSRRGRRGGHGCDG